MEREKNSSNNKIAKKDRNNIKPLIQMKIETQTQSNIQDNSKNDISKVLIYIYYYEKNDLNVKKGIKFNQKEKYYIIKSKWIKELKKYYDYQKISKHLDNFKSISKNKSIIPINLNHLSDNNLLEEMKLYLNKQNSYLLNKQPNGILKDSNINMLPFKNKNNFIYYSNGYIINSTILEIFEKYMFEGQKIRIKPINIFNKDNNIFISLINDSFIFVTFGNLNDELIFTGNSCLCYFNSKTFENEKNIFLNQSFKNYIFSRKCQENDLRVQTLKKEVDKKFYDIGQFLVINQANIAHSKSIMTVDKRAISSKAVKKRRIEKTDSYSTNNSTLNKNEQSLTKNIVGNNLIGRSQTHMLKYKSQIIQNNNDNIHKNSNILSPILEEYNKVQNNANPKTQNKDNNIEDNKLNEQVKLNPNELKKKVVIINNFKKEILKNKKIIDQLSEENRNLMEKNKKNQEQIKILSNKVIGNEKDEKNKNIINEKEVKINELEKEISRLNDLLSNQFKIENGNENLNDDNEIKMVNKKNKGENELTNKINENIELKRNNEELKEESRQKDEQIKKLKNENKEKVEEIKEIKQELDNLKKVHLDSKKNIEIEYQKIINSMIDEQKKKDDELNDLSKKYMTIQKELENQKNCYNKLKEKEDEESKKIDQLQNQLNEKNDKIKNIICEKDVKVAKVEELEKEISRLKNMLNNQTEKEKKTENLNNECSKLRNENLNKDNQIKMLKVEMDNKTKKNENELANKIKENNELQRNNEKLKKESKQKDEQIQKLKNENQINIQTKEKEIKKIKNLLDNLKKENENLKNKEIESQNIINSMNSAQKEKDDKINDLNIKYKTIQMELEKEKNVYNKSILKESEESKKIYQNAMVEQDKLKKQLNEKEKMVISLNEKIKKLEFLKNEEKVKFENECNIKRKELNEQISKKEKEINDKISFLEDKENMIDAENKNLINNKKQIEELKKEYERLINENKKLENQFKEKQMRIIQNNSNINQNQNSLSINVPSYQNNNYCNINQRQIINQGFQNSIYNPIPNRIPIPLPPKEKDLLEIYKEPTLIGLNNIGATCFMNSTLQCLSQTKSLTNYFLKGSKYNMIMNNNIAKQNKNLPQLTPVYLKLIKKLWDKNKKGTSFSPNEFMETVEKMNPLFKKGQAGDSKDFIIFILEQIHKELKRPINPQNQLIDQPLNQYDRDNAFKYFMNDFQKECSIISDVFFGFTETTNVCHFCKNLYSLQGIDYPKCYNYGIFNCLIFPLEEVKNFRNKFWPNFNIQINQNNSVTLNECFFFNQKTETFTGENRNYCNNCKQLFDSEYTSRIYSSPNVLILILNRGKDNKYNIKLDFTETFDLTQFVKLKDRPQMIYNLYGVITHYGQSGPNAHFIAFCKSPINNQWYKYNDAIINPVKDVQKEIINFGTPYILFYQKSD